MSSSPLLQSAADLRDPAPEVALRRALDRVAHRAPGATLGEHAELRAALGAFVDQLRGDNCPPERVLVQLKEVLLAVGLVGDAPDLPAYRGRVAEVDELRRRMITWAIGRYYASRPSSETGMRAVDG